MLILSAKCQTAAAPATVRAQKDNELLVMEISIPTTPTFSFKRTAISHGWYDLPPFELTQENWTLSRVIDLGAARPLTVAISEGSRAVTVKLPRKVGARAIEKITRD